MVRLNYIKKEYLIKNLHCAGCAAKIEEAVSSLEGIKEVHLNFTKKKITLKIPGEDEKFFLEEINELADSIEPGTYFEDIKDKSKGLKIKLSGLNCAGCAVKIEDQVSKLDFVNTASLNFSKQILDLNISEKNMESEVFQRVEKIVKSLEPHVNVTYEHPEIIYHDHGHDHFQGSMAKKELLFLMIGGGLFIAGLFMESIPNLKIFLMVIAYILVGGDIVINSFKNIKRGNFMDENFLMTIATFGAFAIGETSEAVGVMLFYKVGEYLQDRAVENSRKSIESLMDIRPDYANLKDDSGKFEKVSPEKVNIGDIILVKPGEKVPLDGQVSKGRSAVDVSALTGESLPVDVSLGDEILSGSVNKNGTLEIKVSKDFSHSTVSKILEMVENASSKKAPSEKFITKFAKFYTPVVVISALMIAFIPPIFVGEFSSWFYRALIFLVISCPCALVVSIPLSFFSGIGAASKKGILVKGGNYLEALNNVKAVVFDKTGTLTMGKFKVTDIMAVNGNSEELLELAAAAEWYSTHPIAQCVKNTFKKAIQDDYIEKHSELEGYGIEAYYKKDKILTGNGKLLKKHSIDFEEPDLLGTVVHVAKNDVYAGYILISDEIKKDSPKAVKQLKEIGIKSFMLTGDSKKAADRIGKEIGIEEIHSELLPNEKVDHFQRIKEKIKGSVIFVGDGINDAPVLALSDIGVAMGGIGSDSAIEAADVIIMTDEPSKLCEVIDVAKFTRVIVLQNISLAIGIKLLVMALGIGGVATMWEAIFADVGVALLAVLNSMRILKHK
nr:heavy metal translocating P-type ATPase [uncultured Ilyobacter sp.]